MVGANRLLDVLIQIVCCTQWGCARPATWLTIIG